MAYVALSLLMLFGAISSQNNVLFWLVGVAIAGVIVHGFVAGPAMMGLRLASVDAPQLLQRGQPGTLVVELGSVNRFRVARALRVQCRLVGPLGSKHVVAGGIASVRPGGSASAHLPVLLPVRGVYRATELQVSTTFPFGLTRKALIFRPALRLVVTPALVDTGGPERQGQGGQPGFRPLHAVGADHGVPIAVREYRPGDPRRLIAWKATARTGRLMVREFEEERTSTVLIVVEAETEALRSRQEPVERVLDRAAGEAERSVRAGLSATVWHPGTGSSVSIDRPGVGAGALAGFADQPAAPGPRVAPSAERVIRIAAGAEP